MTRRQFTDLVEGSQAALRRFLVALCCGDAALADDIAQDAYLKAYISFDRLNEPDKFNVLLFCKSFKFSINASFASFCEFFGEFWKFFHCRIVFNNLFALAAFFEQALEPFFKEFGAGNNIETYKRIAEKSFKEILTSSVFCRAKYPSPPIITHEVN